MWTCCSAFPSNGNGCLRVGFAVAEWEKTGGYLESPWQNLRIENSPLDDLSDLSPCSAYLLRAESPGEGKLYSIDSSTRTDGLDMGPVISHFSTISRRSYVYMLSSCMSILQHNVAIG
jgi:hypothetical protein